ncbi:MAG: efflux RND transporter periplasmic adaptor subunit [Bryobacteraceae bacterium]|nr:efflux RND transporter periplasmic adaptor subunit [Bryobacteraceae bacterium]
MKRILFLLAVVLGLAGLFYAGWAPRQRQIDLVTAEAKADSKEIPVVTVSGVKVTEKPADLLLPATVTAIGETPVYARAEGYIVKRYVDIGDYVKKGQVLVQIDSPEQDQQLRQARSRLDQLKASLGQVQAQVQVVEANLHLAEITAKRQQELVREGVFSKQMGDESAAVLAARQADKLAAEANVNAARENIKAQEAEVQRITELTAFQKVTAPFDGLITVRNCAVGNLITTASLQAGRELFRLSDISVLRVFVNVPQQNVDDVIVGQKAVITLQDLPKALFAGKVTRTANALDLATRTLLTEVQVTNQGRTLLPGMYARAQLEGHRLKRMLLIPGDTLLTPAGGPQVATVGKGSRVKFVKVEVGRDYGLEVEITGGLTGDEVLVVNPSDDVREGAPVRANKRKM